jgi:hypothetical protein
MRQLKLAAAVTCLGAASVVAPVAGAHNDHHARVLRAKLNPVPIGDYGLLAHSRGRVQLVDGKINDKLSIKVKGLSPGTTYPWHLHVAAAGVSNPCAAPPAAAPSVDGWTYRPLKANRAGNASSRARSKTFTFDKTQTYYVDVHLPTGNAFLCGVLPGSKKHKVHKDHPQPTPKPHEHASKGKGH